MGNRFCPATTRGPKEDVDVEGAEEVEDVIL